MRYLRITIKDTLGFWDDYLESYMFNEDQGKSFTSWYRLPDAWVADGALTPEAREAVYRYWYGENWRLGNGDGSQFIVLATDEHELTPDEVARRAWETSGETCLAAGEDGQITKVDANQLLLNDRSIPKPQQ